MSVQEPSQRDWELLVSLAWTGSNEYPWAWEDGDWPESWGSRDYEDALRRCAAKLREEGKL